MRVPRRELSAYRVYLLLEFGTSILLGIAYATITVYWVTAGQLDALQLLLLGTGLEVSYFLFQLPTGVLADIVSRRLCVLAGLFIIGLALVIEAASPSFANLLAAQFVLGLGYALNNGAQEAWIADELAASPGEPDRPMAAVYMRATQLGLLGTVAGSLLSGLVALGGLNRPLLLGGALICLLAIGTAAVMPERNFRPPAREPSPAALVRQSRTLLAGQLRGTHRAIVAVPGLALLFMMTAFTGMWSESFDRLWGALLIRDIGLPQIAGLHPAMWFSLLSAAVAVLALGSTELARRRAERLGADAVAGALLGVTLAIGAGVVTMATSHSFVVAVAAYLVISVLRPVTDPLIDGWMVTRIEPSVRATALSARDMFDSGGQIIGGPLVGVVGSFASIRIALLAGAAALGPAAGCIAAASRRIQPRLAGATGPDGPGGPGGDEAATAAPGLHG
jgi:MFS transporter, DHA3 family, tetracycline resistance protein